jgi:uncharacterized protein with von Willebrand factor type A (vWA) domain
MTEVLSDFIRALRSNDVRISAAEAIDAARTLSVIGYNHRDHLRDALGQSLAKTQFEKDRFRETFDQFFRFDPTEQAETPESEPASDPGGDTVADSERSLADMIMAGDQAGMTMAMAQAARAVGLNDIVFFTQRGMYALRMLEAMGLDGLETEIQSAQAQGEGARADALTAGRDGLRQDIREYIEKQLSLFTANTGRKLREDSLAASRLWDISPRDMKLMHDLVQRMAKRLVSLHSRRKKMARRGHLDVRRTIRANIEFDGILFHTIWRRTKVDRPKVIAVCDVSGSVAKVSQFLLMFLYSLQDVIPNVRSFAFSGRLEEVTDLFEGLPIARALDGVMNRCAFGSTDYGRAFVDLEKLAFKHIDHRTTVLILGDARSNNIDPRADILKKIHDKARRVLWLNPEAPSMWDSGDSIMRRMKPHCDRALTCASLNDLEKVISDLLRTAV